MPDLTPHQHLLAEAIRICNGQSPLKPERAHLQALKIHLSDWCSAVMETSTPHRPTTQIEKHLECGHCLGTGLFSEEKCPVCDGEQTLDYGMVAYWFDQSESHRKRLIEEKRQHTHTSLLLDAARRQLEGRKPAQAVTIRKTGPSEVA